MHKIYEVSKEQPNELLYVNRALVSRPVPAMGTDATEIRGLFPPARNSKIQGKCADKRDRDERS